MNKIKNTIFTMAMALFAISFNSCQDDSSQAIFEYDELPKIFMTWEGTLVVQEGQVLTFEPIVSPADGATFSWKINGKEVANTLNFSYEIPEFAEDFELRFDVVRNGVATHRQAEVMINVPFVPKEYNKKSVGFVSAETVFLSDIVWDNLTHLVVSSGIVAEDGTVAFAGFNRADLNINTLIALAHRNGVFVLLDVAGQHNSLTSGHSWGEWPFYTAILDEERRANIISEIMKTVKEYGFDGINVYFDRQSVDGAFAETAPIVAFFNEFANAVPTENLTTDGQPFFLTQSVYIGWTQRGALPQLGNLRFDWFHVLAFGAEDLTPGPHSSMWTFTSNTEFYINHGGIPAEKMVPVAPAFGLKYNIPEGAEVTWDNLWQFTEYMTYRSIIAAHPNAYQTNSLPIDSGLFYDGFPAIDEKAATVIDRGWGGMGLWKVDFDTTNPNTSLLHRMNQALGN